jgi:hypothetical protein
MGFGRWPRTILVIVKVLNFFPKEIVMTATKIKFLHLGNGSGMFSTTVARAGSIVGLLRAALGEDLTEE